ncbi:AzlC family ABC transporter permease [Fontibacillus sp. BL9]|uniref:AzlC family ABC transporter permease n=1 Tax=Fontibacillus sp. BL9 TaxID=3389971 RepID=UPI00397C354A
MNRRERMMMALRDGLPIVIAYFPLSVTFGVLAAAGGWPTFNTVFSSVWIYSGGAQFMLLGMVASTSASVSIISTILLVNLRHVLYGATVGPYLKDWKEPLKWAAAFGMTDEGFAVISSRAAKGDRLFPSYYLTFAFMGYGSWIAGTLVGSGLGGMVTQDVAEVLSFALPALFIALLFGGTWNVPSLVSASTGAALATLAAMMHWGGIGIVLGGIVGATAGKMVHSRMGRSRDLEQQTPAGDSL